MDTLYQKCNKHKVTTCPNTIKIHTGAFMFFVYVFQIVFFFLSYLPHSLNLIPPTKTLDMMLIVLNVHFELLFLITEQIFKFY